MKKVALTAGCWCVEIPEVGLSVLCGAPENAVKFLYQAGCIHTVEQGGVRYEVGPNAILLSETPIQNGAFCNLGEFPVLHMLYLQGMVVPGHPNHTGRRPLIIGLADQVEAQCRYIFAGNYGLSTEEEMVAAGMSAAEARRQWRMKLYYAFGRVKASEELLDLKVIERDAIELAPGVFLCRKGQNLYEFIFAGQTELVDLNLAPGESYGAPYRLPARTPEPAEFAVVHLGDGDGWDPHRPCTGSLLRCGDQWNLVDAGPNLKEGLEALGLGVGQIAGLFQTHAHDDHFVGLTALMRSETRIRFYSVPWVRASVVKKFSALTGLLAADFHRFFEVHDLEIGVWNEVEGVQVLPLFSPHPVETTVFHFRVSDGQGGWKSYAHLADISSFEVLDAMVQDDPTKPGLASADVQTVKEMYLLPADLKKLDIGGGMIHGHALDFRNDSSGELLLSHTGRMLTAEERRVGRRPEFGETSILVPAFSTASVSDWSPGPLPSRELAIRALFHPQAVSDRLVQRLADAAQEHPLAAGQALVPPPPGLLCVVRGTVCITYGTVYTDRVSAGGFFGEEDVLLGARAPFHAWAETAGQLLVLPTSTLEDCPLLLWKLRESLDRRVKDLSTVFRFEWCQEYRVGVAELDEQHRQLFQRIASIGDAVAARASSRELTSQLQALEAYTLVHFETEQRLMKAHGYPIYHDHFEKHRRLAVALDRFSHRIGTGDWPPRHELMEFLRDWLLRHTLLEDRKYISFFASVL